MGAGVRGVVVGVSESTDGEREHTDLGKCVRDGYTIGRCGCGEWVGCSAREGEAGNEIKDGDAGR